MFGDSDSISGLRDSTAYLLNNLKRISFSDATTQIDFGTTLFSDLIFDKIVLPANLTIFYINNNTTGFEISQDNLRYETIDGILYTKDNFNIIKTLYLYPAYKEGETLEVSEGIEAIAFKAFSNTNLKTVILPTTFNVFHNQAFIYSNIERIEIKSSSVRFDRSSFHGCQKLY